MYRTIHIEPAAPPKPAWGEPCNGCGVCCLAEPCPVGMLVSLRRTGACRALVWHEGEGRYRCGVVNEPQRFVRPRRLAGWLGRRAMRLIAAGKGCDCRLEVGRGDAARP